MSGPTVDEVYALGLGETADRFSGPMHRLLYLRASPNLSSVRGPELTALAQHSRERFFPKGTAIFERDSPVAAAHFLVEGSVDLLHEGKPFKTIDAPWALGMLPMFAGVTAHAVARTDTLTLEVDKDRLYEVLEDNTTFLDRGIGQLLLQLGEVQRTLQKRGLLVRSEPHEVPYPEEALDMVQRIGLFRRGPYEHVNLEPVVELARQGEELRFEDGHVLWREGDTSGWGCHIVHGVVRCEQKDGVEFKMGPDSVIGYFESHSAQPRPYTATVEGRFVAFSGRSETFFNVVEDNFELGLGFLSFISSVLLELYIKLGESGPPVR